MSRISSVRSGLDFGGIHQTHVLDKRSNRIKLALILASLVTLIGVYLWTYRGYLSGFTFLRLGELTAYLDRPVPLYEASPSFPFFAYFLGAVQRVLGASIVDVAFLPLFPVLSPLFVYPLARLFLDDSLYSLVASVLVFLFVFATQYHVRSYAIAKLFFLLFVFATILFLNNDERYRFRFGLLSIGFYLGVKFFGPPIEAWAVTWVGVVVLLLLVRGWFDESLPVSTGAVDRLTVLWLALIVMLFAYNVKFYDQLLVSFPLSLANAVDAVSLLGAVLGAGERQASAFAAVTSSPRILQYNSIVRYLLILGAVGLVPLVRLVRYGPSFVYRRPRELLAASLLAVYLQDLLLYALVGGGIQLRYVDLVFPVVALYYYRDVSLPKVMPAMLVLLLLSASFGLGYEYADEIQREYAGGEQIEDLVRWQYEYTTPQPAVGYNAEVTTDMHTWGAFVAQSGMAYDDPHFVGREPLGEAFYVGLNDTDPNSSFAFDYYVLDVANIEYPLQQGPPSWIYYEPMAGYVPAISEERSLQKVFTSDSYQAYRHVGGSPPDVNASRSRNTSRSRNVASEPHA